MCACVEIKTKRDLSFAHFLHRSGARSPPCGELGNDSYFSLEGCCKNNLLKCFQPGGFFFVFCFFCNFMFIVCSWLKLDLQFEKSLAAWHFITNINVLWKDKHLVRSVETKLWFCSLIYFSWLIFMILVGYVGGKDTCDSHKSLAQHEQYLLTKSVNTWNALK